MKPQFQVAIVIHHLLAVSDNRSPPDFSSFLLPSCALEDNQQLGEDDDAYALCLACIGSCCKCYIMLIPSRLDNLETDFNPLYTELYARRVRKGDIHIQPSRAMGGLKAKPSLQDTCAKRVLQAQRGRRQARPQSQRYFRHARTEF